MNHNLFGIPIYYGKIKDKEKIEDSISNVDLKKLTRRTQTEDSINYDWNCRTRTGHAEQLIDYDDEWVKIFLSAIQDSIVDYYDSIKITDKDIGTSIKLWVNYYEKGDWQEQHTHTGETDFVFNYVYKNDDQGGEFVFHNPLPNLNHTVSNHLISTIRESWDLNVSDGEIVIFPAWMPHSVKINKSENARISISGNVTLKDTNESTISEL